jgi:ribonuclease J
MVEELNNLDNELDSMFSWGQKIPKENKKNIRDTEKKEENKNTENKQKTNNKNTVKSTWNRNNSNYKKNNRQIEYREKFISKFPETKFYLPSLREGYTRYMPIWGNDETGSKNMSMAQYGDDIVLIDCWIQFTDYTLPWVNYSIPDVSFLTKYTKNIKGMIITHAHLDHIWALKHIYPAVWFPPLYWTKLTLGFVKKQLEEAGFLDKAIFVEIDAWSDKKHKIWEFEVEFFRVNHSVPDCAWFYMESPGWAKFVHTWDFKIDFTPEIDAPADLERIWKIWARDITLFLSDSTGATRKWHSMSEANVWEALDEIVRNHKRWRLIIAAFSSWISRVQQLINIADKYWKTIFLSWRSMIENVAIAKQLGYLKVKPGIVKRMTAKNTEGILPHNQIIITTGSQWEQFSALTRMAEWSHNAVEIVSGDTIVFSSSVVPGNDRSVIAIINKLIKLWANVLTKDDWEYHTWGHAFQEEQKIFLNLIKPKYFMPIYGDLYFRTTHAKTAMSIGFKKENILLVDNGQIVDFAPKTWNVFKSRIKAPIQEIIIDGYAMSVAGSHVLKAREKMMEAWVLVLNYKVDKKTRALVGHIKIETRGLVYLDEVKHTHRWLIKKSRDLYENTIKDVPDIEEKELLKIIKTDLEAFLLRKLDREPMIIPMITEV